MLNRMWGMLKVAGAPLPYYGSAGINVTSEKCLAPERRGGIVAGVVNVLGMIQSVVRYLLLPLAAVGILLRATPRLAYDWIAIDDDPLLPATPGRRTYRDSLHAAAARLVDCVARSRSRKVG